MVSLASPTDIIVLMNMGTSRMEIEIQNQVKDEIEAMNINGCMGTRWCFLSIGDRNIYPTSSVLYYRNTRRRKQCRRGPVGLTSPLKAFGG